MSLFKPLQKRSARKRRDTRAKFRTSELEQLEERIPLVIGAFDIPVLEVGSGFDGVARINRGTGALLATARHVLTAAHVSFSNGPSPTKFWVTGPSGVVNITTPADEFTVPAGYPQDGGFDDFDIGVTTLAELAPLTADRWDIYTDNDEVGKVGRLVGYGGTGTGTIGHSTDVNPDQYWSTSTGTETNYEVVRFTITGNPTGGSFFPRLSNEVPPVQPGVPYDTNAATLAAALNNLPGISQVLVRLVGDSDFDGMVEDDTANPHAGSFEVLFRGTESAQHALPGAVIATQNFTGGTNPNILIERLLAGGTERILTSGRNLVSLESGDGTRLYTDFDDGTLEASTFGLGLGQGANEAHGTWGDSGSPLFIDGKIAGVLEGLYNDVEGISADGGYDDRGGSGDFGEIDSWGRVSFHQDFINYILDDPFDLVLNMETQPWGGDGIDDEIEVSRFGDTLQIRIDGVLYYAESIDLIESVTIHGSTDDETIIVSALGDGIPVVVSGHGGSDLIRLDGLSDTTALLFGQADDDTFVVGDGNVASNIKGSVHVFGGDDNDSLVINDEFSNGNRNYTLAASNFTMSSYPENVFYSGLENIHLQANTGDNTIRVPSTAPGTFVSVSANSGDDVFRFGGDDIGSNIGGDVQLHGGFGEDILVLLDRNDEVAGDAHTLDATTYTKTGYSDTLTFNFMQGVRLRTGATDDTVDVFGTSEDVNRILVSTGRGSDEVRIHAKHANTVADIRTGRGSDTVKLTPSGRDLDAIGGYIVVNGGPGSADELLISDQNDAMNDFYAIHATSVFKSGFQVDYSRFESLTLAANPFDNAIFLESVGPNTEVTVNAGDGRDTIHVAAGSLPLAGIQGAVFLDGENGEDSLLLHDENNPAPVASLTIQDALLTRPGFELHYEDFADLVVLLGAPVDLVDIQSTESGMDVLVRGGGGSDSMAADVPTGARLTLHGAEGADSVALTGTPAAEEISVSAGFGTADVNLVDFEQAEIDLHGGTDAVQYLGVEDTNENVEVRASATSAAGRLSVVGTLDLMFRDTEIIDLVANANDMDTASFIGTRQEDEFALNLAAKGTDADPVLQLVDADMLALLTLSDYRNFGTLNVQGDEGADEFNVHVAPAGPGTGRDLSIDGGNPSGQGSGKDELKVLFQTPPKPDVDHDHDNQNNFGMFDIAYELEKFFIKYSNIEKATAKSDAAG